MLPTRPWTQQLAQLRARAAKLRSRPQPDAFARLADETLALCAELLDDFGREQVHGERLREDTRSAVDAHKRLFDIMPCPCVMTDRQGTILHANAAAARFLNMASKRLEGRELLLYNQDRDAFLRLLANLPTGENGVSVSMTMRPRERRPLQGTLTVTPVSAQFQSRWLWFFVPTASLPMPVAVDSDADGAAADPVSALQTGT
jgi:PAS domain-containing protein